MITDEQIIRTAPTDWLATCSAAAEHGTSVVDWLTAVDRGDGLEILVLLVEPGTGNAVMVGTWVDARSPSIASLAGTFPGAEWHERETAEMFGVEFTGRESTEPLLLRGGLSAPMRKSFPLDERLTTPWPGEDDTERRRRRLPPGVRPEWSTDRD